MTSGTLKLLVENHKSNLIKKKNSPDAVCTSHIVFFKNFDVFFFSFFPKLANQNKVSFLGRKGGGVLKTQDLQWCVSQKG